MNSQTLIALVFSAGLVVMSNSFAFAEAGPGETDEMKAIEAAKITVQEAANAAIGKVAGKVSSVQIFDDNGKPVFHVEVMTADGKQQDLAVVAVSGDVTQMATNVDDDGDGDGEGGAPGEDPAVQRGEGPGPEQGVAGVLAARDR